MMADDLDDAVARLLKRGEGHGGSRETPLLVDLAAMAARDQLRNCLSGWVSAVAMVAPPAGGIHGIALWLLNHMPAIRLLPQAGEMLRGITMAVTRASAAIDRRPGMLPAGACDGCGSMVYAEAAAESALCECGLPLTGISRRREAMVRQADVLGSPAEIVALLATIGRRVTEVNIRVWRQRGRVEQRPGGLYRLSDVLELVAQRDARAS